MRSAPVTVCTHHLALGQFGLQLRPRGACVTQAADVRCLVTADVVKIHHKRRKVAAAISTRPALELVDVLVDCLPRSPVARRHARYLKNAILRIPLALILAMVLSSCIGILPRHVDTRSTSMVCLPNHLLFLPCCAEPPNVLTGRSSPCASVFTQGVTRTVTWAASAAKLIAGLANSPREAHRVRCDEFTVQVQRFP